MAFRKQYEIYKDSLVNIENVRKIEQTENQYFLNLKEADIRFLEEQNRNKRNILILLSVGAFILLSLLVFVYSLQLSRKKALRKVSEQKDIIEKREKEKALLLKELNHRVKNNLQMVSSMFSLQAGQLKGEPGAEALLAARHRIEALMLIHQKLYRDDVDTTIDLVDYIRELTNNLVFGLTRKVNLILDLSPAYLYIDSAIPLGIIFNELLTNALKYGFKDNVLTLNVSLKEENNQLFLIIADNGAGVPPGFDMKKSRSLGLRLVYTLVQQLNGQINQFNDNGCRWEIVLNINN
ncbi:sensor histidine kinase [Thermophagus xiamenensis]|uniref:histidine kinase n=1 Tax=Thermophagus xiamenensis TaxID=385682 RepID=A0A1I1V7Z7_9BACT|nr:sensor histidine kinase [Thermophagus xiamenensis]SFD79132.1 Two-component sensor histidine kinase, contains HisKA and HATPase domains [Thermophagus xiamenensis]